MSLSGSGPPLRIDLRRSRLLTLCLFLLLASALTAVGLSDIGILLQILFALMATAGVAHALYVHAWRLGGNALIRLNWSAEGRWTAMTRNGSELDLQLAADSYWHADILVLNFRAGRKRRSVVLLPDMIARGLFRQLRVRIRLEGDGTATPA